MRLQKISVKGLFGVFDHDIPLNLGDHITIVSGPNGFGKTVVLKLIHALLTGNTPFLKSVPFTSLTLTFDDGTGLEAIQTAADVAISPPETHPTLSKSAKGRSKKPSASSASTLQVFRVQQDGVRTEQPPIPPGRLSPSIFRQIDRYIPGLSLQGDVWRSGRGEEYTLDEVLQMYRSRIPDSVLAQVELLPGMRDIQDAIHVQFISTQRLDASRGHKTVRTISRFTSTEHIAIDDDVDEFYEFEPRPPPLLAVVQYSEETASNIKSLLERYAARAQELDRTFPERLLRQDRLPALSPDDLRTRLRELEAKRANLVELGFLDREEQGLSEPVEQAIRDKGDVLSVYVQDTEKKLSVFDEMAGKIGFFVKRINERFRYKQIAISRDRGFVLTSKIGALRPEDLSSGEQHELVLLYELLFRADRTWLVLIDEPEISLHVGWQEDFVRDLQEIIRLSEVDIVVATHSPVIIGDHWRLTVELSGPEDKPHGSPTHSAAT